MKKIIMLAVLCLSLSSVVMAYDSKAVVSFAGYSSNLDSAASSSETGFTARMYNRLPSLGLDVVWGGSLYAAGSKNKEFGFSFLTGLELKAPVFGGVELVAQSGKSSVRGSAVRLFHTVSLNKNFLYSLTEKIQVGLTVELARFAIDDGNSYVAVLNEIKPVVAVNIALF
jgi:hypothetical protein